MTEQLSVGQAIKLLNTLGARPKKAGSSFINGQQLYVVDGVAYRESELVNLAKRAQRQMKRMNNGL